MMDVMLVQRLIESFNENKYPERDVRENLATELGLTLLQVNNDFLPVIILLSVVLVL